MVFSAKEMKAPTLCYLPMGLSAIQEKTVPQEGTATFTKGTPSKG
jgi:hypothetical protein